MKVVMDRQKSVAVITCGSCKVSETIAVTEIMEPIDVYGEFIDAYYEKEGLNGIRSSIYKF